MPKKRGQPGDKKGTRRKEKEEKIIQGAISAFRDMGVTGGFREIAARSGCSTATIQKYFGTRENLVEAVLATVANERTIVYSDLPADPVEAGLVIIDIWAQKIAGIYSVVFANYFLRQRMAGKRNEDNQFIQVWLKRHHPDVDPAAAEPWHSALVLPVLTGVGAEGSVDDERALEIATNAARALDGFRA